MQAHRGVPITYVENTVPGFLLSTEKKLSAIEMDIVVTKDQQLVVCHEPFVDPELHKNLDKKVNIYDLNYGELKKLRFSDLLLHSFNYRPLLKEVIEEVLKYCHQKKLRIPVFTIEVKYSSSDQDFLFPSPRVYAQLVRELLDLYPNLPFRLQSFDLDILRALNDELFNNLIYLKEDQASILQLEKVVAEENIKNFGLDYRLVTPAHVTWALKNNFQLSVWTVNKWEIVLEMIELGITNIISDHSVEFKSKLEKIGYRIV